MFFAKKSKENHYKCLCVFIIMAMKSKFALAKKTYFEYASFAMDSFL